MITIYSQNPQQKVTFNFIIMWPKITFKTVQEFLTISLDFTKSVTSVSSVSLQQGYTKLYL